MIKRSDNIHEGLEKLSAALVSKKFARQFDSASRKLKKMYPNPSQRNRTNLMNFLKEEYPSVYGQIQVLEAEGGAKARRFTTAMTSNMSQPQAKRLFTDSAGRTNNAAIFREVAKGSKHPSASPALKNLNPSSFRITPADVK